MQSPIQRQFRVLPANQENESPLIKIPSLIGEAGHFDHEAYPRGCRSDVKATSELADRAGDQTAAKTPRGAHQVEACWQTYAPVSDLKADPAFPIASKGHTDRTVQALAVVAEVVHGAPCRFSDPARFSFAHGGKDQHPFPVPVRVYDETIAVLKSAVQKARLGQQEELCALKRLDEQARTLERHATSPAVGELIRDERANSPIYGGRSVGDEALE
jgi:hypothetical protein